MILLLRYMPIVLILLVFLIISGCLYQENPPASNASEIYQPVIDSKTTEQRNNYLPVNKSKEKNIKNDILIPIYPQVWSQHSPAGESWEFKVNCFGNYSKLEECFLSDLDAVRVITPNNSIYALQKDFNINNYSMEITRRWVLYGPAKALLPETGKYIFEYVKNKSVIYSQKISYDKSKISYPTEVKWKRTEKDLHVTWTPPHGIGDKMNYKAIIWNENGTPPVFVSKVFQWNATGGILENVPFAAGGNYSLNIAIFFQDGYAYSEYIKFKWN